MLLTEFDEKKFAKTMYSEGLEDGLAKGLEDGLSKGLEKGHQDILNILSDIQKGNNTYESLISIGYEPELVKKILELQK